MSTRWTKLGAKPADRPYVEFYARKLKDSGWSERDIDEAISFGLKHQNEGWAKFEGLAIHEMQKRGIDGTYINEVLTPGDIIVEQPDIRASLEAHSFAEAHASGSPTKGSEDRISEIQRTMREDPHKYWNDEAMQKEFASLIEAKETGAPSPAIPTSDRRRSEIEALMKEDGGRGYWNREDIRAEYASLIEASTPQEAADVGT